ncbi:MAG TPA: universal stress protein [Phycisphaerae bacterium]|nr:universal stress protein [Phycisphaerae bacterium]
MKTLLVCIDFSDVTECLISNAIKLAQAFEEKIFLLHVTEPDPDFIGFSTGSKTVREQWAKKFSREHAALCEMQKRLHSTSLEVEGIVVQGAVADKILQHVASLHADMILMGTHGHGGLYNLLVGSVTGNVLKRATCPVVLVNAKEEKNAI